MLYRYFSRYPSRILGRVVISSRGPFTLEPYLWNGFCSGSSNNENVSNSQPHISISKIRQALDKQGIQFSDGFTNLIAECNSCKKKSLFINKVSGFCICNECRKSGSWLNNNSHSSKSNLVSLKSDENIIVGKASWKSVKESLLQSSDKLSNAQLQILNQCKFKNFPKDLVKRLHVHFDTEQRALCVPLTNGSDEVGYKRITADGETTVPANGASGLIALLDSNPSAVVVPSLKDLVALSLQRIPFDIICLPYGQQKLPQEILPLFENYKKIVLWFDNDSASWDNTRVFAKKLCEDRCFLVSPSKSQSSAHKAFEEGSNLNKIIGSAQPISHPSITTFSSLREDVLFDLQNIEKVCGVKWRRFPALNSILKGHRRGELSIMTGSTGCGKTTFMSEYSLDLAVQGVNTLWGSFEIKNQRLARTMLQQFTMTPLENNIDKFDSWADRFQQLPIYFMTFHGQQSLDLVMDVVEHATYVHDIAHVIIDNVQFMLGLTASETGFLDRFYRQDALIGAFRNFATKSNCHVTLVIHPRKEREGEMLNANSIFGGAKASQEADNILIMQTKTLTSLKVKKYLQIAKNRYTGDLGLMPLEFDPTVLSFSPKDKSS